MGAELDTTADPASYFDQAIRGLRRILTRRGWDAPEPGGYPGFGRLTGVVVNYAPDRAVRFDLEGNALEMLPRACCIGEAEVRLRGRPIPRGFFTPRNREP